MPRFLILYGTTDGHTGKIARFVAGELAALGATVNVVEAGTEDPRPRDYDGVIVAASLHARGYQHGVIRWTKGHAQDLGGKPGAFLSVCLGVLQKDLKVQQELVAIVNRFEQRTGWQPPRVKLVAGALLYTRYGWLKRMVMRGMSKRAGGSTDISCDHEYTDWSDLRDFAEAFYTQFAPPPAPVVPCEACACSYAAVPA